MSKEKPAVHQWRLFLPTLLVSKHVIEQALMNELEKEVKVVHYSQERTFNCSCNEENTGTLILVDYIHV